MAKNGLIPEASGPGPSTRNSPLDRTVGQAAVSRQLREVFREAFDQLGGAEWLVAFAKANDQNARVFVQAISKLLPASAPAAGGGTTVIVDIPWLTRDRLAYQQADTQPLDADVVDVLPRSST